MQNSVESLFFYPLCPFARKVRFWMQESGITFQTAEKDSPFLSAQEQERYGAHKVLPMLIGIHGEILSGSTQILAHYNVIAKLTNEVLRLQEYFDTLFWAQITYPVLNMKIFSMLDKNARPNSESVREAVRKLDDHMEYIAWLMDRREWLAGDELSLVDMSAAAHVSCVDYFSYIDWEKYPAAKSWYMRIKSRPAFASILADKIRMYPPAEHYAVLDF